MAAFIHKEGEAVFPRLGPAWCSVLFAAGGLLWCVFFNWGRIPFDFHDWAEINAPRLAFVRDAVLKGVLPLHMPDATALRGVTDRFLALPDVIVSPQVVWMRFLDIGTFILLDMLVLYTLGFLGLLWLRWRYKLSLLTFSAVFLIFNFNGHLISHLSVGHVT
jgi:hypothetical protein